MSQLFDNNDVRMSINAHQNNAQTIVLNNTSNNTSNKNISNAMEITKEEKSFVTTNASAELNRPTEPNLNNMYAVLNSLLAGATAGALAKTTIAPLDRAKINFQINKNVPYSFQSALLYLNNVFTKEGIIALWRGNSATMARIIPYAAIQFTSHEQYKKMLRVDQDKSTNIRRFLAGSLAGVTSQSLTYPLDLARARMAVTDKYSGYRTLREVFIRIWKDEGPKTFFRGYWATVLGVVPYAGMSFFTYETLKRNYHDITGEKIPNQLFALMFGAIAGVVGQTSSYPLDIVRRRLQTLGIQQNCVDQHLTIWQCLVKIYREEGIRKGFFKGLSMNWIKGPIAVGISFSTYEHVKQFLNELNNHPPEKTGT